MADSEQDGGVHEALVAKGQPTEEEDDLYPNLDGLVPASLSAWGVFKEAYRLMFQYSDEFLLPMLLLAAANVVYTLHRSALVYVSTLDWGWYWNFQWLLTCSVEPAMGALVGAVSFLALGAGSHVWLYLVFWASVLLQWLLTCFAEAAFGRAIVRAYLRESNYRRKVDHGDEESNSSKYSVLELGLEETSDTLLSAAKRCMGTLDCYVLTLALVLVGVGSLCCLLVSSVVFGLFLPRYGLSVLVLFFGLVTLLFAILLGIVVYLSVLMVVAFPASVLTKVSSFKSLRRSLLLLTSGNRWLSLLLLLCAFAVFRLVGSSLLVLQLVSSSSSQFPATTIFFILSCLEWILSSFWCTIRGVFYLRCRAASRLSPCSATSRLDQVSVCVTSSFDVKQYRSREAMRNSSIVCQLKAYYWLNK